MRKVWLAAAAAVVLAGCQQTPPPRRPGLWLQTFSRGGDNRQLGAMRTVHVCVDANSEARNAIFNRQLAVKQAAQRHCQTPTASRSLDGIYKFSANCPLANGTGMSLLTGTASGDFNTTFHLRMQTDTTYAPPYTSLNSHLVTDIDGKWLGPCPPGMAGGDMVLANGLRAPGGKLPTPVDPRRTPAPPH